MSLPHPLRPQLALLAMAALPGCLGSIPPTNPYDEDAPPSQQAPAVLAGRIVAEGPASELLSSDRIQRAYLGRAARAAQPLVAIDTGGTA